MGLRTFFWSGLGLKPSTAGGLAQNLGGRQESDHGLGAVLDKSDEVPRAARIARAEPTVRVVGIGLMEFQLRAAMPAMDGLAVREADPRRGDRNLNRLGRNRGHGSGLRLRTLAGLEN